MPINKLESRTFDIDRENYIPLLKGELSLADNGWSIYSDGTAVPVDGTGGLPVTPIIDASLNFTNPLSGDCDLRLTKGSFNLLGQGLAIDFSIQNRHLAKVLQLTFDTELFNGIFNPGDIKFYIIANPGTSNIIIEPVNVNLQLGIANQRIRHVASFQTHISITSYRLCIHISSTTTNNYTVDFANFRVWEPTQSIGAVITDWQSYTMTITGTTTNPTKGTGVVERAMWRRVGSNAEIFYTYNHSGAGSAGSGNYLFSMPPGLSIDTSKLSNNTGFGFDDVFGVATVRASTNNGTGFVSLGSSPNTFFIGVTQSSSGSIGAVASNYYNLTDPGIFYSFMATVPIAGWGSSVVMSSDTGDSRVVAGRATVNNTLSVTANQPIAWQSVVYDTHAGFSSGRYTVPVSGYYQIFSSTYSGTAAGTLYATVDGVTVSQGGPISASFAGTFISDTIFVRAGQIVDIRLDATVTLTSASIINRFSIIRVSAGSQVIASSETVNLLYTTVSNNHNANNSLLDLIYNTRVKDSHGAYNVNTGIFTAPMSGTYNIYAQCIFSINTAGTRTLEITDALNTTISRGMNFLASSNGSTGYCDIKLENYPLLSGQQIKIRYYQNSGGNLSLTANNSDSRLSITRTGNY